MEMLFDERLKIDTRECFEAEKDKVDDYINNPKHYTQGKIEPIDYILANKLDFLEGNIVKYVTRYKFKNGVEDLKKAEFYFKKLIEREEEK